MNSRSATLIALITSSALAMPLSAQDGIDEQPVATESVIVVEGRRLRGELQVEEAPVLELSAEDIDAIGAGSIQDVLAAIAPATGSARGRGGGGRPVFLINGIRVSSFREFFRYPPEAIAKVEVFPEETAQKFGFAPDQRVVNIILKEDYSSITAEVEYEGPDSGGYTRNEQELTYFKTAGSGRLNFNVEVQDTSALTEAERGLEVSGAPQAAEFRTLIADSFGVEGTANYARSFIDSGASLGLTATGEYSQSLSLSGLRDLMTLDPLERRTQSDTFTVGSSYSQPLGAFRWTNTFNGNRTETRQEIERFVDGGFDLAQSNVWSLSTLNTLQGVIGDLPAGEFSTTFDFGYDWTAIASKDTRSLQPVQLKRGDLAAGVNVSLPLTSRRTGFLDDIGTLSLNMQAGVNELSDFGTLIDWSVGLNWSPVDDLDFQVTRVWREVAPGLTALGNPETIDLNVPVFDFATGEDALVTVVTGGNPNLLAETQADWKFGANLQLPFWDDARLRVDYAINKSDDVTLQSPSFTAAFEQAFPDRVTRGAGGELLAIDRRPLTLFETRTRTLSFGINARGTIGKRPERQESRGGPGNGPPSAGQEGRRGPPDPERFAAMRERFCASPEGQTPDLSALPEGMRSRLLDENGNPDPQRISEARSRFCGADADALAGRFAGMRQALCSDPPDIEALPPPMLERLRREDGSIDPERLAQARERICADGAGPAEGPPRGARSGRGGPPGLPFGGGDGDSRPRYFLSLTHTIALKNEVTLAPGGPVFDQLDGEVLSGGSVPRHTSELEGGLFFQGYGVRLSGRYTGEAELLGSGAPGSSDLFLGDLATFDVRLFADLGRALKRDEGWLKGLRLAFRIDNLFDARRRVVDANGDTPFAFNPLRLDPTGRYLGVDLRKQF